MSLRFFRRPGAVPAIVLCLLPGLRAAAETVEFFRGSFLPQAVTVELGDEVEWVWRRGSHTVTSGRPDGVAGTLDAPGRLFDVPLDEEHPAFRLVIGEESGGGFSFFCREHPGQVGFVEISGGEVTIRVGVVDNAFLPDRVFIFEGDSVRWEHEPNEGFHTVTSGRSSEPEDAPGELFDVPSSDDQPIFVHRFDAVGTYPYFCRPHELVGMVGAIHVQRKFLRGDVNVDGAVDVSDAVAALGWLFLGEEAPSCLDAGDANDDGQLDIADPIHILQFLFLGGQSPPPPHPRAGGDRTEDGLLCGIELSR